MAQTFQIEPRMNNDVGWPQKTIGDAISMKKCDSSNLQTFDFISIDFRRKQKPETHQSKHTCHHKRSVLEPMLWGNRHT